MDKREPKEEEKEEVMPPMTEEQAEYYLNETIDVGGYDFTIKLSNAVNVGASCVAFATYLAINMWRMKVYIQVDILNNIA